MIILSSGKLQLSPPTHLTRLTPSNRSSTCLYQASLTILIANNLTISHHHLHHHIESDTTLIEQGLKSLRLRLTDCNIVLSKHCSIQELYERSKLAVQAYTAEAATSSIPIPLPF